MTKYNGWTNYETWCAYTWLTNEESSNHYCYALIRKSRDVYAGSNALKDYVWELKPYLPVASLFSDLLNAALGEINWIELAKSFTEDDEGVAGD